MSEQSAPGTAVGWYDTYLVESPGGTLAAEALGRKMLAVKATAGIAGARAVATAYRRRYPGGTFASAADEILADR
jgi:hypothetical protein